MLRFTSFLVSVFLLLVLNFSIVTEIEAQVVRLKARSGASYLCKKIGPRYQAVNSAGKRIAALRATALKALKKTKSAAQRRTLQRKIKVYNVHINFCLRYRPSPGTDNQTNPPAITVIWDRLAKVDAQSDVSGSGVKYFSDATTRIGGSNYIFSSSFEPKKYSVLVSSNSGDAYGDLNPVGSVNLMIYKYELAINKYVLLQYVPLGDLEQHTSSTNFYGDQIAKLNFYLSSIILEPGEYLFAPYQAARGVNSQGNMMFINMVSPTFVSPSEVEWTAMTAANPSSMNEIQFNFIRSYVDWDQPDYTHFADRLEGILR